MSIWPFGDKTEPVRAEPSLLPAVRNEGNQISLSDLQSWDQLVNVASAAGPLVTADTAMRSTAVYACVRIISGAIASMPFPIFRRTGTSQEQEPDHDLHGLLNRSPNPLMTAGTFRDVVMHSVLLQGDSYSAILRERSGRPTGLLPFPCSAVSIERRGMRYRYRFADEDFNFNLDQDDVLHIPGIGFNPRTGRSMSPIRYALRNAVGIQLAADEYSARFFSNDATPAGVLRYPGAVTEELGKTIRELWMKRYKGVENSHLPGILPEGGEWQSVTLNAEESQLMEARQFQIIDICRAYGVPPFLIAAMEKTTSWGSGIEQMSIGFVMYTLRDHMRRITEEVDRKVLRSPDHFSDLDETILFRGDSKTRGGYFRQALGGSNGPGWMTVNEVRRKDNLPDIAGGDVLFTFPTRNQRGGDNAQ